MTEYREIPPSARFAEMIECYWTGGDQGSAAPHRVMPDGCADILFTRAAGAATIAAIGPMTTYQDHEVRPGHRLIGVRFRPGMWRAVLGVPGDHLTDGTFALEDLWNGRARDLSNRLGETRSLRESAAVFEGCLRAAAPGSPIEKALAWMERRRGCVSVDELASAAGLSARQFRRLCLEHSGLTPKLLARVLRFRHAYSRLAHGQEPLAALALDCGYYDQAHCINEVREFSGRTPGALMADFSNPRPRPMP